VRLFSPIHLALIAIIAAACIVLSLLCRWKYLPARPVCLAIGWVVMINELIWWVFRYSHEGLHLWNLPLQLCDATLWMSVLACFTYAPLIVEFAYFGGLAGAGMAVITPDLWSPWPSYPAIYFFIAHGGIVLAVCVLVFGRIVPLAAGAMWRAYRMLLGYAAAVGAINAIAGTNFMYLRSKPQGASLLDSLGPWPIYLIVGAALALLLFWLLWLPVRPQPGTQASRPASSL